MASMQNSRVTHPPHVLQLYRWGDLRCQLPRYRLSILSIAAKDICFARGRDEGPSSGGWMSLTSQYLQTGVHCGPAPLRLTTKIPEQDGGSIIDIAHGTFCAMAANLDHNWPLKSDQARHLASPSTPTDPEPAITTDENCVDPACGSHRSAAQSKAWYKVGFHPCSILARIVP